MSNVQGRDYSGAIKLSRSVIMISANKGVNACQQRLLEADHHMETGHFRSAVESASGGVELLLQGLYDELLKFLSEHDFKLKLALEARRNEKQKQVKAKGSLTFCEWIDFYKNEDVFNELVAANNCQFFVFNENTLHTLRILRNKCVHENYRPSPDEANWVRQTVAVFLRETSFDVPVRDGQSPMLKDLTVDWQNTWNGLIDQWIEKHRGSQEADLLSTLLDQLMLIAGLVADDRVSFALKTPLIFAIYYVIDPADLIPESQGGVEALIDDAVVLTFTLSWFMRQAEFDPIVLREHWPVESDPAQFITEMHQHIFDNYETLFNEDVWPAISEIPEVGPQAVWRHRHSSERPSENDVEDAYRYISEEPDAESWYETWRVRVQDWVFEHIGSSTAEVVYAVPDLFYLCTKLLRDKRVSSNVKARLAAVTAYVVSPYDLLPEGLIGVAGLIDDAGALAIVGYWLVQLVKIDRAILREHWRGEGDPVEVIGILHRYITNRSESLFDGKLGIWENLQRRFGSNQTDGEFSLLKRILHRFSAGSQ